MSEEKENREITITLPEPAPESEPGKDLDHETRLIRLEETHRLEMERLDRELSELRASLAVLQEEEREPAPSPAPNPRSEEPALLEESVEVIPPEEEPEEEEVEEEPEPRSRNLPWYL